MLTPMAIATARKARVLKLGRRSLLDELMSKVCASRPSAVWWSGLSRMRHATAAHVSWVFPGKRSIGCSALHASDLHRLLVLEQRHESDEEP
jgi:hypothetical protein